MAVSDDFSIYVLDDLAQEIRVFDRAGQHITTFGRRGQGPGEFGYADGVTLDSEGNVLVFDPRNSRVSVFDERGTYLRAFPHRPGGSLVPWPAEVLPDGTMLDWRFSLPERSGRSLGTFDLYQPVRIDLTTGAQERLPGVSVIRPMSGDGRIPGAVQFAVAQDPRGHAWFSHRTDYVLYRRTPQGDTTLVVSRDDAERVTYSVAEADSLSALGRPRPGVPSSLYSVETPTYKPAIDRVIVDGAGHLLVFPKVSGLDLHSVMDVFVDETGEYLGRVELPIRLGRRAPARVVRGSLFAAIAGEFDIPTIVRVDFGPNVAGSADWRTLRRAPLNVPLDWMQGT